MANSSELKAEAMAWLRFGKRMPAVCTELKSSSWVPDVVGANRSTVIEVEVKISRADIRREFDSKQAKIFRYMAESPKYTRRIPNQFYYMVPVELQQFVIDTVEAQIPKAGVLIYRPDHMELAGRNLEIVRPAKSLHRERPGKDFLYDIFLRMGSELCGSKTALVKAGKVMSDVVKKLEAQEQARVGGIGPVLDIEDPGSDLENRAIDLANEVGPLWVNLSDDQKQKWRQAVRKVIEYEGGQEYEALYD